MRSMFQMGFGKDLFWSANSFLGQHTPNEAEDLGRRLNAAMGQYDQVTKWLSTTPNPWEILAGDSDAFHTTEMGVRDIYPTVQDILARIYIGQTEFSDDEWATAEQFISTVPGLVATIQRHTVTPTMVQQAVPRQPVAQAPAPAPVPAPVPRPGQAVRPQARPGQAPAAAAPAPSALLSPLAIGVGAAAIATLVFVALR